MEPASIDPALPVFPLDGDPLNDPLNDLDLFNESLGFNMGPIDKVHFRRVAKHFPNFEKNFGIKMPKLLPLKICL